MWSFGCLMAELKIGEPIFAGSDNTEQLMYIANSIGYPQEKDG
jgi:serine/threonine protein kinase